MKSALLAAALASCVLALVSVASAAGGSYSSCSSCRTYQKCFPCVRSNNVWCTDLWDDTYTCCSSTWSDSVTYCTGVNCCGKVTKIIIGVAVAGAIVALAIGAFLIFWCIRTRRNRVDYGGFPQQPEVVEIHHGTYQPAPAYGATSAQVGYQAPVYGANAQVGYQSTY